MSSTTPAAAPPLSRLALGDFAHEMETTRRVLERVPEDRFGWKPHEKSWTLAQLATHVATLPLWLSMTLQTDELDLGASQPPNEVPATRDELLARFDQNAAGAHEALSKADDATLTSPWTLRNGEQVFFTLPKLAVVRGTIISHLIHHRGQLSVYLRLLDVPVPAMYGPSADEPGSFT